MFNVHTTDTFKARVASGSMINVHRRIRLEPVWLVDHLTLDVEFR